jgi:hypothetical protein
LFSSHLSAHPPRALTPAEPAGSREQQQQFQRNLWD